jgi:hypothetical protein
MHLNPSDLSNKIKDANYPLPAEIATNSTFHDFCIMFLVLYPLAGMVAAVGAAFGGASAYT